MARAVWYKSAVRLVLNPLQLSVEFNWNNSTEIEFLPLVLNNRPADFADAVSSSVFAFRRHHHLKYEKLIDLLHNIQLRRKTVLYITSGIKGCVSQSLINSLCNK
jgi:hypothetical protein